MLNSVQNFLATTVTVPVPDSGMTAMLVTCGVITLGVFARFVNSRKK